MAAIDSTYSMICTPRKSQPDSSLTQVLNKVHAMLLARDTSQVALRSHAQIKSKPGSKKPIGHTFNARPPGLVALRASTRELKGLVRNESAMSQAHHIDHDQEGRHLAQAGHHIRKTAARHRQLGSKLQGNKILLRELSTSDRLDSLCTGSNSRVQPDSTLIFISQKD